MARYEDYEDDESFDYGSLPEIQQQEFLYELIGFTQDSLDRDVHDLFWDLMYNDELSVGERSQIYDQLSDHLWDLYGLDFQSIWDWEDFRAWYETQ